jgi:mRNA interferase MazF
MPSEAHFGFGDVILVPFPFTDQSAAKRRPAVVISSRQYNLAKPDLIVMAVTSQLRSSASFGEVWLTGWAEAGLLKPSAVKPVIATLERNLAIRSLGALSVGDRTALREAISAITAD